VSYFRVTSFWMRCGVTTTILLLRPWISHLETATQTGEGPLTSYSVSNVTVCCCLQVCLVALLLPGSATPNTSMGMEAAGMRLSTIASCRKRLKGQRD
jgi:hypothetical protein